MPKTQFIEISIPEDLSFWEEEFLQKCQKEIGLKSVHSVYIYDENRHVHLCELTPSYELHFAYTAVEYDGIFNDLAFEQQALIEEIEFENGREESVRYHHARDIDRAKWQKDRLDPEEYETEEEYGDLLESVCESVRSNPSFA